MGSGGKTRWKLSFHHRPSSPTTASRPSPPSPPPPEFTCPISGALMSDPVILPSGHTFDRPCIQACIDHSLSVVPNLPSISLSPPPLLIPNSALKSAILSFCHRSSLPPPLPLSPSAARLLIPSNHTTSSSSDSAAPATPPLSAPSQLSFSSSSSSSEITVVVETSDIPVQTLTLGPPPDPIEDEIIAGLTDPQIHHQDAALAALRRATRETAARRNALCTPRLLAALRPFLLSRHPALQAHAAAALVNLSLEPANKVRIVRSGAVPRLVDALRCGHPEARDHAAGALFSLALNDDNKAAIAVLGAVPPLLNLFSRASAVPHRARRDAGMALYHLSLAGGSRTKIVRTPGAVRELLAVAAEPPPEADGEASLAKLALMVVCSLAGFAEGRAALMDAGAVAGLVEVMRRGAGVAAEEYCVVALHGMSRGSLRFRGLARVAGAEEVLMRVAEGSAGEVARETARRTVMAMRGEEEEEEFVAEDGGSVVSDGLVSFRRRCRDFGGGVSGANSAEF